MEVIPYNQQYFDALFRCFIEVFSVSKGKIKLTKEEFEIRITHKLGLHERASRLLVEKDKVLGFVLHTVGDFRGKRYLYNGGTGILESERKKRLGHVLLEKALSAASGLAEKAILEVVEDNEPALKLYESHGFEPTRPFKCFRRERIPTTHVNNKVDIGECTIEELKPYVGWNEFETSFADSMQHVARNTYEMAMLARLEDEPAGFIVLQPHIGRISQLVVNPAFRRRHIASTLIKKVQEIASSKSLTMMNIPYDQTGMIQFLETKGFVNGLNQIEMEKTLPH